MSQLRVDNEKLLTRNRSLQREVEELRRVKTIMEEDVQLKPQINQMTMELTHAKEALSGTWVLLRVVGRKGGFFGWSFRLFFG